MRKVYKLFDLFRGQGQGWLGCVRCFFCIIKGHGSR